MLVPTDNNPFKWSEIHSLAKAKLEALDQTIREEIQARLEPLPANGGTRHQFFVLLSERVDDWATRAKTAYLDCLTQIGREPSQPINHSIWENGLKFFIAENLRRYMILACGITAQELKWAEEGSPGVRGTPQVKAVLFTLNDINRIVQLVRDRFQPSMISSGDWLTDARKLLQTIPVTRREDTFVTGRAPGILSETHGLAHPPLQVSAKSGAADKEGVLFGSADCAPWQKFADDFSMLAQEERNASAPPLGVMALQEPNLSSDVEDWKTHDGYSENLRARFELLASKAGNALGPLPNGASPFCYWLHRLYQHLCENRSSLKSHFISDNSSHVEVPLIHNACEASSIFCLRIQKRALEDHNERKPLSTLFREWVEDNLVETQIPGQISDRNRVSVIASFSRTPIPVEFLSSRLQAIYLFEGFAVCSSREFIDIIAKRYGLVWVVTSRGLWMAQHPPGSEEYIDSHGIQHRQQTPQIAPLAESESLIQSDAQSESRNSTNKERIDKFIDRIKRERGAKISKTDINRVAGYKDRRQFEEWQSGKLKSGATPDVSFNRVLSLSPVEFLQRLQTAKALSGRKPTH